MASRLREVAVVVVITIVVILYRAFIAAGKRWTMIKG
jgi:hypothetical protein